MFRADDSVPPSAICAIAERFPFAEWGILFSRSQEGTPRFPSMDWLRELLRLLNGYPAVGAPLRRVGPRPLRRRAVVHPGTAGDDRGLSARAAKPLRGGKPLCINADLLADALKSWGRSQYILQFDEVNDVILSGLVERGVDAVPLFDTSGGAGIEPATWPSAERFTYSGYAGGLHPDRIVEQMKRIAEAAGDRPIWVDVET